MMQAFESILPQKYQHCIKNGVLLGQSIRCVRMNWSKPVREQCLISGDGVLKLANSEQKLMMGIELCV